MGCLKGEGEDQAYLYCILRTAQTAGCSEAVLCAFEMACFETCCCNSED